MKNNYAQVMDWIFVSEGGYAERDSEPGGAVNMGISFTAFKEWWTKNKKPGKPSFEHLKALTRDEAETIYKDWFFKPLSFEVMPSGVDYALVDFAVNSGVGGSIRAVRRQLGFPASSKVDASLSWRLRSYQPDRLIDEICDARLELMKGSKKWERFKENWTNRVNKVRARAHAMNAREVV